MSNKFTRGELKVIAETDHVQCGDAAALARMALAAMDSEPVAYIFKHPAGKLFWALTDESNKGQSDVIPVYAAPVVSESVLADLEYQANHITAWHHMDEHSCKVNRRDLMTLVNACRATMLATAPQAAQND